jgi:hypothetical protein
MAPQFIFILSGACSLVVAWTLFGKLANRGVRNCLLIAAIGGWAWLFTELLKQI